MSGVSYFEKTGIVTWNIPVVFHGDVNNTPVRGMLRRPVQRLRGGGDVTNLSPFWEGTARKDPLPGIYLTNSLVK